MKYWEQSGIKINNRLEVTDSQPILTRDGWLKAEKLKIGSVLIGSTGENIPVKHIEQWNDYKVVYHFGLDGDPVFIAEGILIHNKDCM